MDRLALCNDQRFSGNDSFAPQKPFHARPNGIGHADILGNNGIFAFVENFHARRGGKFSENERTARNGPFRPPLGAGFLEHFLLQIHAARNKVIETFRDVPGGLKISEDLAVGVDTLLLINKHVIKL